MQQSEGVTLERPPLVEMLQKGVLTIVVPRIAERDICQLEEAERIAQSEVAWAIFVYLAFLINTRCYLIKTPWTNERSKDYGYEQSKADSTDEKSV